MSMSKKSSRRQELRQQKTALEQQKHQMMEELRQRLSNEIHSLYNASQPLNSALTKTDSHSDTSFTKKYKAKIDTILDRLAGFFVDIAKYLMTVVVIASVVNKNLSLTDPIVIIGFCAGLASLVIGLLISPPKKKN